MGKILLSELQSWYNAVNNIVDISKGSASNNKTDFGNISISSSTTAKASDINALATKLEAFKNDTILGSNSEDQALYGSPGIVSAGGAIKTEIKSSYDTIVSNLAVIKCRNTASNVHGYHTNEYNSNTSKSNTNKSNTKKSNTPCSDTAKGCGTYSQGTQYAGAHTQMCSYGTRTNGRWDYGNNSCGTNSCGTNSCGTNTHEQKTNGDCSYTSIIDIRKSNATNSNN